MWKEREGGEGKEGRKVEEKAVGNGEECSQHPLISSLPWPQALHELVKQWTFINLPPPPPHRHVWETVSGRETTKAFKLPLFPGKGWGRFGSERQTDEKKKKGQLTCHMKMLTHDETARWALWGDLREKCFCFVCLEYYTAFVTVWPSWVLAVQVERDLRIGYILHAVLILWVPRVHWPLMSLGEAC